MSKRKGARLISEEPVLANILTEFIPENLRFGLLKTIGTTIRSPTFLATLISWLTAMTLGQALQTIAKQTGSLNLLEVIKNVKKT